MIRSGCVAVLVACLGQAVAHADEVDHREVLELRRAGVLLPFERILDIINNDYPDAQVLEVELERDNGRYLYEMEILTLDHQFRDLRLDAGTGEVLEDELED